MENIYKGPFSDETKKLKRNLLLASIVSSFIGFTKELPRSISLLGISIDSTKQILVGWFIFFITLYFFLHFLAVACPELARWLQPFYQSKYKKEELLKHPAFDITDFLDIPSPVDEYDVSSVVEGAEYDAKYKAMGKLKILYKFVYLKLFIEIILPVLFALFGLTILAITILSICQ